MNKFDELSGILDGSSDLAGPFSFIEKGIKSAVSKVKKVTSKVAKKVLPSSVRKIGRQLDKSGFNKIAIGAAGLILGAPMIAGAGKAALAKGGAILSKAATIGKSGIAMASKALYSPAGKFIATSGTNYIKGALEGGQGAEVAAQAAEREAQTAQALTQAMSQSPEFQQAVQELRGQGYTDEQILQHWAESKTYYMAAMNQATRAVYPQMVQQLEAQGVPHYQAQDVATMEAYSVAEQAVNQVKKEAGAGDFSKLILPLAGAALLFLNK